jgi:hypothetical protein
MTAVAETVEFDERGKIGSRLVNDHASAGRGAALCHAIGFEQHDIDAGSREHVRDDAPDRAAADDGDVCPEVTPEPRVGRATP